jgi:hypothetical protein
MHELAALLKNEVTPRRKAELISTQSLGDHCLCRWILGGWEKFLSERVRIARVAALYDRGNKNTELETRLSTFTNATRREALR